MKPAFFLIVFFVILTNDGRGQSPFLESNRQGLDILRKALQAHGGEAATDSLRISFKVVNTRNVTPGQSYAFGAPVDEYVLVSAFQIDRPHRKEFTSSRVPMSGFEFVNHQFMDNGKGKTYFLDTRRYTESTSYRSTFTPFLPQAVLSEALKAPYAVRFQGTGTREGKPVHILTVIRGSELVNLCIDQVSHLVCETEQIVPGHAFGAYGDGQRVTQYAEYKQVGKIQMPQKVQVINVNHVNGKVMNEFRLEDLNPDPEINATSAEIPEGTLKQEFNRKNADVQKIAEGVWMIENASMAGPTYPFSYNVVFAEFKSFVLVVEAPWDEATTRRVMEKVRSTVPGKPLKFLVQTHHHEDHIGGLRGYIAEGVTLIASPSNEELIRRIADAPFNAFPDHQARSPRKPLIDIVTGKRKTVKDDRNEAWILDIGPNTHTLENLVVYFPSQKVLYQADMINEGEYPMTDTSREFISRLKELGLSINTMIGTHGRMLDKAAVENLLR